jgi:hypothetical protein
MRYPPCRIAKQSLYKGMALIYSISDATSVFLLMYAQQLAEFHSVFIWPADGFSDK